MGREGSISITMKKKSCSEGGGTLTNEEMVLEGSNMLMGMVGINEDVFNNFVEHKFDELDRDHDGKLSVKELKPVDVANIGAALIGVDHLPAEQFTSSPTNHDSDHIYTKVLNELSNTTNHGNKEDEVIMNKTEFKEVISDILLLGMAAGNNILDRDPIVILRMDGDDLLDFINSPRFEPEMKSIFTRIQKQIDMKMSMTEVGGDLKLRDYLTMALQQLSVDHGMPPSSDFWVMSNIIEPALELYAKFDDQGTLNISDHELGITIFLNEFKKVAERLVQLLNEHPVIVAHTQKTLDGSGINKLLSNNLDLHKALDVAKKDLPHKDRNQILSKEYFLLVLDALVKDVGLPPYGVVDQVDKVVDGVVMKMIKGKKAEEGNHVRDGDAEMKMIMREILEKIMFEIEAKQISFSSNSVIHGPSMITSDFSNNNTLLNNTLLS